MSIVLEMLLLFKCIYKFLEDAAEPTSSAKSAPSQSNGKPSNEDADNSASDKENRDVQNENLTNGMEIFTLRLRNFMIKIQCLSIAGNSKKQDSSSEHSEVEEKTTSQRSRKGKCAMVMSTDIFESSINFIN